MNHVCALLVSTDNTLCLYIYLLIKLTERAAKQALTALTIFFGTNHPEFVLLLQYIIYSLLKHVRLPASTCSTQ